MSLAGRRERGDKLGILKTVQPHSRSRRAFGTSATAVKLEALVPTTNHAEKIPFRRHSRSRDDSRPSAPVGSVRRLSISTQLDSKAEAAEANLPTPPLTPDPLSTDLAAPQTVLASQEIGYKLV